MLDIPLPSSSGSTQQRPAPSDQTTLLAAQERRKRVSSVPSMTHAWSLYLGSRSD